MEKVVEIIDIPQEYLYSHIAASVRIGNCILCSERNPASQDFLRQICENNGLKRVFFDLLEYSKSGAELRCMMMHLNYL